MGSAQTDWNNGVFNGTSADRGGNSDILGIGYVNGSNPASTTMPGHDSLVGQWRLDKDYGSSSDGDTVPDRSGNGNDASTYGGVDTTSSGVLSTGAYLFGDGAVQVNGNSGFPTGTSAVTVSAWFNANALNNRKIVGYGRPSSTEDGDALDITIEDVDGSTCMLLRHHGGNIRFACGQVSTNQWHHVAVVFPEDGTTTNDYIFYVDGVQYSGTRNGGSDQSVDYSTTPNLNIGTWRVNMNNADNDDTFPGRVDEVLLFDTALSASAVQKLYFHGMDGTFQGDYTGATLVENAEQNWANITTSETVPADTAAWMTFEALDSQNNSLENETFSLSGGDNTYDLSVQDSSHRRIHFNGTSTDAEATWTVENYTVKTASEETAAPAVTLNSPSDGAQEPTPVWHNFTPTCNSGSCTSAELFINGTGITSNYSFKSQNTITSISQDGGLQIADIDDDGKIDAVVADGDTGAIEWCEQGDTTKDWTCHSVASGYSEPEGVDAADFDGDGTVEIVVLDQGGSVVDVASQDTSDPTGSWSTTTVVSGVTAVQSAFTNDFTGDGTADFLFSYEGGSSGDGGVQLAEFTGSDVLTAADWTVTEIYQNEGAWWIAQRTRDFNGDGNTEDVVVSSRSNVNSGADPEVAWLAQPDGNQHQSWSSTVVEDGSDYAPTHVTVGNFCGDSSGRDVAAGAYDSGSGAYRYCYADNWNRHTITSSDQWHNIKAVQMDNSGRDELLLSDQSGSELLRTYAWNGSAYTERDTEPYGKPDDNLIPYDLTGDGTNEIFSIAEVASSVDWWEIHTDTFQWSAYNSTDAVTSGVENSILFDYAERFSLPTIQNWNIKVTQSDGQTAFASSNRTVTVDGSDTTPPSITIHSPANTTYSSSTLDLNVAADETIDVWQKSVDGGANETFTPNGTLSGLSDGSHKVTVWANNTDGWGKQTQYFTVDTTPPQWQELQDNASSLISAGTVVNISADWAEHGSGMTEALLATNQTGTFHNVTATTREDGFEDNDLSQNFTWEIHKGSLDLTNISVHSSADARTGARSLRFHVDDDDGESYSSSNDWATIQTPVDTNAGNETFQLSTKFTGVNDPAYVAKSIGLSSEDTVDENYDFDYRVLFGDDTDANSQEIQIGGTSFGDYVKDSYYTVTFDAIRSDEMVITVSNSTHEFQKTVSGPSVNSMSTLAIYTDPEAISYPYEHYMFVDDVTITENVGAISADDGSYRPMYFDNTTGNSILTDFLWSDASFDGLLGYRIWASDSAGNWDVTDTGTLAVNQPPSPSNLQATPDPVEAGDAVNITVSVTDPDANTDTVRLNLTDATSAVEVEDAVMNAADGDEYWYAYTPAEDQSSLGEWTIDVEATDIYGASATETGTFTVQDTESPAITYQGSTTPATTIAQDWIFFNVSATDNIGVDTVFREFDGANTSVGNDAGIYYWLNETGLSDGTYTLHGFVNDTSGNGAATDERSITLDTTPPSTTDNWTVSGWQNTARAYIELTASDATSSVDRISYRVDGGSWTTVSGSTATVTISTDGNHTVEYNATDTVGNQESTKTEYVALDTTPPAVSYTESSTASGTIGQDWILVNISAADSLSGLDWVRETFDGTNSTFTNTAGQYRWENHTGLPEGTYTVQGWANDTVSNYNFTAERTVTVDTTAPTVTLHEPRNITYNSSTVPLNATANEAGDTWRYSLDGGANTTFTPNATIPDLTAGTYTLDVYSTDAAGNTGHATVTFTVAPDRYVVLREGATIRQPDNNVQINVTSPFNVSDQLRTFSDATQFDTTNWTVSGSTGDFIGIHLDWFNGSMTSGYAANYSVDTTDDNTVTFSWVNAVVDTFYDVFINSLFDTQYAADGGGSFSFTEDSWSSGDTRDNFSILHTSNGIPQITSTLFRDDRKQDVTRLEFDLDDRGDADLRSYHGDGSATTFTNSSLAVDILLPVTSTYNITDREGRTSPDTAVSVTETDSGLQEDAHPHTLDTQQVNRSVTVCNNEITGLGYNLTFANHGTGVTAESFNGTIPATECVTETGIWSGDWLTNEQELIHKRGQNGSRVSNSSRQHFFNQTAFQADNSQQFPFIGVDLSPECSADPVGMAAAGTSNLTTNCNNKTFSGDFVNDTEFGFDPEPTQYVTLGINYYGHRQLQLNNTQPVAWGALNTTTGVTPPTKCTQTNNTVVGLAAGVTTNYTVRFSCPPGTLGSGTQKVKNISSDKERVWFNISGIEVHTNHTDELQFRREVNKDNLKNPNERDGGTLEGYADGNQINVSVQDESDKFVIIVGRNHTNSSWHKGTHTAALTYTLSDDSTTIIEDSGGSSSGAGGGTTTIIQNVTGDAYSWTVSTPGSGSQRFQFFGHPGRTFSAPLELENTGSGPVNLSLQCIASDGSCDWVELSTDHVQFDASSFTETTVTVSGQVPLNASRDEYNFVVRVTDPSYDPQNPEAGGKGDVRFSVDMNRPLGFLIERYGRLAGIYTTIEAPDGAPLPEDAHGLPIPFVLIPLFFSGAVFAVARAVDDSGGGILAAHILLAVFVFIMVTGVVPPL